MPQTPEELAAQFGGKPVSDIAAQFGGKVVQDAPTQPPMLNRVIDSVIGAPGATEVLKGAAKSVLGAVEGGGKLIRMIPGVGPALASADAHMPMLPVSTTPTNAAQAVGKSAGDVAMFFAPSGLLSAGKAALATGGGILDALVGAGLEGASAAGVTGLQTGDPKAAVKSGAITAGTTAALSALQPMAKALGERIESALVKPSTADVKDGFKIGTVFKYDLGGTLRQTYDKTETALGALSTSLKNVLAASPQKVDLLEAMAANDGKMRALAESGKSGLSYGELKRASDTLLEKLLPVVQGAGGDPAVDALTANRAKQIVGDIGAWTHGIGGQVSMGTDANALEQVANGLYDELKTRLESSTTGPVKALNSAMSDIISVRRAVIRRIPVAERANIIRLTDALAVVKGGPTGTGLAIANHVLRSGQAANALVKLSQSPAVAPTIGRVAGAIDAQEAP